LQKRPIILSILLTVATPYVQLYIQQRGKQRAARCASLRSHTQSRSLMALLIWSDGEKSDVECVLIHEHSTLYRVCVLRLYLSVCLIACASVCVCLCVFVCVCVCMSYWYRVKLDFFVQCADIDALRSHLSSLWHHFACVYININKFQDVNSDPLNVKLIASDSISLVST